VKRKWLLTKGVVLQRGETEIAVASVAQRKCTMQGVLIAALRHRYLSSLTLIDQSIAKSVSPTTGSPERKGTELRENHAMSI